MRELRSVVHACRTQREASAILRGSAEFERFMRLAVGRVGQLLNLQSLAADTGVSGHTAREWITLLEASFIVFRLPPWFANIGKRLVKSPKLYFHVSRYNQAHLLFKYSALSTEECQNLPTRFREEPNLLS